MTEKKVFGYELIINLPGCSLEKISSKEKLTEYIDVLCAIINMKKFGRPRIKRFGLNADYTAGYSLHQFIETSSISGHFSEAWRTAYINIFSCRTFDPIAAVAFSQTFFGSSKPVYRFITR